MQIDNDSPDGVNRDIAEVSLQSARGPIAMTAGTAADMLAAADALRAIKRGEKPQQLPRSIIAPTRAQMDAFAARFGVKLPRVIPESGWRSAVFNAATWLPPSLGKNNGILRPGVSPEYLRAQEIRHVDSDEAQALLGFRSRKDYSGLWIPYFNAHTSGALTVNGRPFGRLRLDTPIGDTKYLSPEKSGAQLYVPIKGGAFGKELAICEGEFKALALCETGIRAVAIGGISSAMAGGKLIAGLEKILTKWMPETLYFLGDADTLVKFAFSHEVVKLRKLLPETCALKLPRIPIGMPNGIDDVRAALADRFLDFWNEIIREAIDVDSYISASQLAVTVAKREFGNIAKLNDADKDRKIHELAELGGHLNALSLSSLANSVKEAFQITASDFKDAARESAVKRKAAAAKERNNDSRRSDDVAQVVNDPRPKIEVPASRNRLSSEFARELGGLISNKGFYSKDGIVVVPDMERSVLIALPAVAFRTKIEDHVIPFRVTEDRAGVHVIFKTLSLQESDTVLHSDQFIKQLPAIRAVNNVRLPVARASGCIELLPEGYDAESMTFTAPGGPQIEDPGLKDSVDYLNAHFSEFCFQDGDHSRAVGVAVAGMLTLFCFNIIPKGAIRPAFLYTANSEGGGKTLLARMAVVPRIGQTPIGPLPEREEEIEKRVFAAAVSGSPVLVFDNTKRHVSSGSLESALTASVIEGRILGKTQMLYVENMMTVFMTGNGSTISGDLRRRLLHVELFLRESKSENREIKNPLDEFILRDLRPEMLSVLWGITKAWADAGRPKPKLRKQGYESWSDVICAILEHAGFASPCTAAPSSVSGDRDTEEIHKLVAVMPLKREFRFHEIVELCRENSLFTRLVGEDDEDFERGKKNILGRIFTKFSGRIFPGNRTLHIHRPSKDVTIFYVEQTP